MELILGTEETGTDLMLVNVAARAVKLLEEGFRLNCGITHDDDMAITQAYRLLNGIVEGSEVRHAFI